MAKILVVDYLAQCDNNGNVVGHSIKTINEYGKMLYEDNTLDILVNSSYKNQVNKKYYKNILNFNAFNKSYNETKLDSFKRIRGKIIGLKKALEKSEYDLILFLNVDFILGLYIKKFVKKAKVVVLSYITSYTFQNKLVSSIKNILLNRVYSNIHGIITTSSNIESKNPILLLPDYFYDEKLYSKYNKEEKEDAYLCIGTISEEKDIEGVVDIFKKTNKKLNIVGKFYNENLYNKLINQHTDNIKIENRITSYEEYYELIGKYKYVILPYKKEFYNGRSSGVLLEAIFLGAIVIGPEFLLYDNKICGIEYTEISELLDIVEKNIVFKEINNDLNYYNYNKNKSRIYKFLFDLV